LKIDKEYFFLSLSGHKYSANNTIQRWFRLILKNAGIPFTGNHRAPRVHDLRHTFSLYAMEKMTRKGADMYHSMPILATYLVHKAPQSTEHYVRLCRAMFPELERKIEFINQQIFPEPEYGND
jgi:integrase